MSSSHEINDRIWKAHLNNIVEAILVGRLVLFLGADINLCDRQDRADLIWDENAAFPPSNHELSRYLDGMHFVGPAYRQDISCPYAEAQELKQLPSGCPLRDGETMKLPIQNFSQYITTRPRQEGLDAALYDALTNLFTKHNKPNSFHRFLASLPALLQQKCHSPFYPLIVTTCFDGALEQAFKDADQPVDIVGFVGDASDPSGGHFHHVTPDGSSHEIVSANTYGDGPQDGQLDLAKRPIILKLYRGYQNEDYVITEDHFIDYLSQITINTLVPRQLLAILQDKYSQLLFIGYNLNSWNQRVILRRLWHDKINSEKDWWAIQANPDPFDAQIWIKYQVQLLKPVDSYGMTYQLKDYVEAINECLQSKPAQSRIIRPPEPKRRDLIFFCYSHDDDDNCNDVTWMEDIEKALCFDRSIHEKLWVDKRIRPGDRWEQEIKDKLDRAKVAVLLVSQNFWASKYIREKELPILMEAANRKQLTLFPVLLQACGYADSELKSIQHCPKEPLESFDQAGRSEALEDIARKIRSAFLGEES